MRTVGAALDDSAVHWMHGCYPSVAGAVAGRYEFVQHPGETVYVPNGWWHNVVNLEFSVAVTENFVGRHNLRASYEAMRADDPELSASWLAALEANPATQLLAQG